MTSNPETSDERSNDEPAPLPCEDGRENVPWIPGCAVDWFVTDRASPAGRSYAELIDGYDHAADDRQYQECAVDELFSNDEAELFVDWLKETEPSDSTEITEAKLPLQRNCIGLSCIPTGGGVDCIDPIGVTVLGFAVSGYFDLRTET